MENKGPEFLLKILSGNHQGAEIVFGCETAVVGSATTSDVVLSDSMIEPNHVEITFAEDGITVKPLNANVYIDGKLIQEETQKIESFQFITVGSTHMIIGPTDQAWPAITAADAPSIEGDQSVSEAAKDIVLEDEVPQKIAKINKPKKSKTLFYGAGILLILGVAIALLIFMAIFSEPKQGPAKVETIQLLQNTVRELGLAGEISITKTKDGFIASGYTISNSDFAILKDRLTAIDPSIKRKFYSEEKIVSEISTILATVESRPKVQVISDGVFLLTGYAYDREKWIKLRKRILEEVRGIVDLQDEVLLPQKIAILVRPILVKYKLFRKIVLTPRPADVVIQGLVSADEEENWKLAKNQIERTLGPDIILQDMVKISDPEVIKRQYFGSDVTSVSISDNGMNWISFRDGTKYMVGATLSNGYMIKAITPDSIVLTRDNQTITLKIGDLQ